MDASGGIGLSDHLKRLSAFGDPLEELARVVDFEVFRPVQDAALAYGDGAKGGRPPYDPVAMLKVLVLAAQNNVSDARMFIRTIWIKRAEAKAALANLAYNMHRLVFHERRAAMG